VNASSLDQYKRLLLAKRRELLPATVGTFLNSGRAERWRGDPTDRATEESQTTLQAHLRESDTHLLRAIEEALARIAQGTFGMCDSCKRPIAEARVKLVPSTSDKECEALSGREDFLKVCRLRGCAWMSPTIVFLEFTTSFIFIDPLSLIVIYRRTIRSDRSWVRENPPAA
jgi:DnaK suppressor protein